MDSGEAYDVICPCCEALLRIDAATGTVVFHSSKPRSSASGTNFEDLLSGLERQKTDRDRIFEKEMVGLKNRDRLLEEKFKSALQHAKETKDEPRLPRDIDLD